METADLFRAHVLDRIVKRTPVLLWQRLHTRSRFTHGEAYSLVSTDPALIEDQRPQKLYQERYFRMEHALKTAADEAGVPASAKLIGTNQCHYAYAATRGIGMTQCYVAVSGDMPTPAEYRKQLAEMAEFERMPRLNLGDEPSELSLPNEFNGIVLHSPVGKRFTEEEQQLGAIGFFVPYRDFKGWAAELPLVEIISAYTPVEKRQDRAAPTRKKTDITGTEV